MKLECKKPIMVMNSLLELDYSELLALMELD